MSKQKLSKSQQEVIDVLKAGGRLWTNFGFRSDPGSTVLSPKGKDFKNIRFTTVWKLEQLGLLKRSSRSNSTEYFLA